MAVNASGPGTDRRTIGAVDGPQVAHARPHLNTTRQLQLVDKGGYQHNSSGKVVTFHRNRLITYCQGPAAKKPALVALVTPQQSSCTCLIGSWGFALSAQGGQLWC